jgi:hypothetical protein
MGKLPQTFIPGGSPGGKFIIYKHYAVSNKAGFPDGNSLADKTVRLDAGTRPNSDSLLYLYERADEDMIPQGTSVKIQRFYKDDLFAKADVSDAYMTNLGFHPAAQ